MRQTILLITLLAALASPAAAEMCTLDPVPAATLLLPYFEVDLGAAPGEGVNTVFTIHNALPAPTIAHVSMWTDWSQPVLDFDIFLTGYDAQTFNFYDMLVNGNLPVTADEQSDQGQDGGRVADPTSSCDGTVDSCSPHGSNPSWDASFDGAGIPTAGVVDCIHIFPFFVNPLLTGARLDALHNKLTGQPIDGSCYGADHGDNVARGYLTIDNANACSLIFPNDPGYFGDGIDPGLASNVNQLWGDWYMIDPAAVPRAVPIDPLIHIEADDDFDASSTPTGYTFYGRYTELVGARGTDNREPLGTAWAFGYYNIPPGLVTDLVVWRDSTVVDIDSGGYTCGAGPDAGPEWHPQGQTQVVCFDESESTVEICADSECFPLESQRVELGDDDFAVTFAAGWCYLNLNTPGDLFAGGLTQSWVGATLGAGTTASGRSAVTLAHACQEVNVKLVDDLFADGFESGDTSAWSMTVP